MIKVWELYVLQAPRSDTEVQLRHSRYFRLRCYWNSGAKKHNGLTTRKQHINIIPDGWDTRRPVCRLKEEQRWILLGIRINIFLHRIGRLHQFHPKNTLVTLLEHHLDYPKILRFFEHPGRILWAHPRLPSFLDVLASLELTLVVCIVVGRLVWKKGSKLKDADWAPLLKNLAAENSADQPTDQGEF